MYVSAWPVGFHHAFVSAVECSDTKFYLGEVQRENEMSCRSFDKIPHADGVIGLAGHILAIGSLAVHPPCVRGKGENIQVDASRDRVGVFHIAIDVSTFELAPLAIFLHQGKEPGAFRAVLVAPFFKKNHGHIVRWRRFFLRQRGGAAVFPRSPPFPRRLARRR